MTELSLDPQARARYGIPEWLGYDLNRLSAVEMATIQAQSRRQLGADAGYNNPGQFIAAARRFEPVAWLGLVWSALRRAGVDVAYGDVDFDMLQVRTRSDETELSTQDETAGPGKGDATGDEPPQTASPT